MVCVRVQATVDELKAVFAKSSPKHYPSRQRFTTLPTGDAPKGVALTDGKLLSDFGITDGVTLVFKDLGTQVQTISFSATFRQKGKSIQQIFSQYVPKRITLLQVGYSTVFFWEYFGPLALYAAVYFFPQVAYPHIR